jgi:uncharacterized protein (TIGR02453 family)
VKPFSGIPVEAFEFYEELAANNTKTWWSAHKAEYERHVRDPLTALLDELAPEFGDATLFRPYRDVRFSKDKTPIKDHQGGYVSTEDAVGYYVQISASGLMVAGGWYAPSPAQLKRYRDAVASGKGKELRSVLGTLEKQGWHLESNPLKTRPQGYPGDHPDLDLLRCRLLTAERHYDIDAWMGTRKAATRVRSDWRKLTPLVEWVTETVGPADR